MNSSELAKLLGKEESLRLLRSLQGLGVLGKSSPENQTKQDIPQPILEWEPQQTSGDLTFKRPSSSPCKPNEIRASHPQSIRVLLFGESMAAGFPLAPAFTPAMVLEKILQQINTSEKAIEVIDLAVPNMGPSEQLRVAEAARQLMPDICIFLTGNNWYYGLSVEPTASPEARTHYANQLNNLGISGLSQTFRDQLTARSTIMVKVFTEIAHSVGATAIFAIPPANHDWERRTPAPWLGSGNTAQWSELFRKAESCLTTLDYTGALAAAESMEKLEGRLTGTPQRIYVRAFLGLGDTAKARDYAARAIEDSNWQNYTWALPQVPSFATKAIKAEAHQQNITAVDLEAAFAEHTQSSFLDFRMFYDHCHLTAEGIHVAMAAIAEKISPRVTDKPQEWQKLLQYCPQPHSLVAASASFQAAHWLSQFYPEIIKNDLRQRLVQMLKNCLVLDNQMVDVLINYIKIKSQACSPTLNPALEKTTRIPGITSTFRNKRLNAPFLEAIIDALNAYDATAAETAMQHVISTHQQQLIEGQDLSHTQMRNWFWEKTPLAWDDPNERHSSPYYQALWSESHFSFLTDATSELNLDAVIRSVSENAFIEILINNTAVIQYKLSSSWKSYRIQLPQQLLRNGINTVSLLWPTFNCNEENAIQEAENRYSLGIDANIFPVFGEIYTMRIHTA